MKTDLKPMLSLVSMPSADHALLLEKILSSCVSGYQNVTIAIVRQPVIEPDVAAEWSWLENKVKAFERKSMQQIAHMQQQMQNVKQVFDELKSQLTADVSVID